jgi:hypothetical protein
MFHSSSFNIFKGGGGAEKNLVPKNNTKNVAGPSINPFMRRGVGRLSPLLFRRSEIREKNVTHRGSHYEPIRSWQIPLRERNVERERIEGYILGKGSRK